MIIYKTKTHANAYTHIIVKCTFVRIRIQKHVHLNSTKTYFAYSHILVQYSHILVKCKDVQIRIQKHLHLNSHTYLLQISNRWVALMSSTQGVARRVVASPTFWPGNRKWTACISQSRTRAFSLAPLASIPSRSDTKTHMNSFQERHLTSRAAAQHETLSFFGINRALAHKRPDAWFRILSVGVRNIEVDRIKS